MGLRDSKEIWDPKDHLGLKAGVVHQEGQEDLEQRESLDLMAFQGQQDEMVYLVDQAYRAPQDPLENLVKMETKETWVPLVRKVLKVIKVPWVHQAQLEQGDRMETKELWDHQETRV